MKMQLKSLLLLMGVSFITFAGCKKTERLISHSRQSSAAYEGTEVLTTTTTATLSPGVKIGTFTAIEALGTSGTYVMTIDFYGMAIHCTTIFTPAGGDQFTTFSECQMTTLTGQWRVIDGKGAYANLQANGSVIMKPGHEYCTGRLF